MGKPKNKTKGKHVEDEDSDVVNEDLSDEEETKTAKQPKKGKKKNKKKDDDWEDDIANELAALSMEANPGGSKNGVEEEAPVIPKKEKKKTRKAPQEVQGEEEVQEMEEEEPKPKSKGKKKNVASFSMLMMDDEDEQTGDKSQSEDEREEEKKQEPAKPSKQQKKKDKKKGKGKEEDEELDALLAQIEQPKASKKSKKAKKAQALAEAMEEEETSQDQDKNSEPVAEVPKVEPKVVTIDDLDDEELEDKKKKKKAKKAKKEDAEDDEGNEEGAEGEEEEGGTVKTAAQKKKEKKERERLKKLEDKKKKALKQESKAAEKTDEKKDETTKSVEADKDKEGETEDKGSDNEGEKEGGKKKKKAKGEKEEKKKKSKPPVAAIKELLKKQKEEEERLRLIEDERIRKEEEEIKAFQEKKQLEDERRAKKKEKERLRKDDLRKKGLLLTDKQKQDKKRAQQMLETLKAQGLELPTKEEGQKKRPVYYDKKRRKPQNKQEGSQENTPSPVQTPVETPVTEEAPTELGEKVETKMETEVEEKEDAKDAWDLSSEEEEEGEEEDKSETVTKSDTKEEEKVEVSEEEEEEEEEEDREEEEEDESEEESEEETESESEDERTPKERAAEKIRKRQEVAEKNRTTDVLRAPVVCVLGHVDTGKTKILDKLRRTNVQDGEAGGITQQIGATNVPQSALKEKTTMCKEFQKKELKLPGLLIIDTPGHESFSNLRSRGSSLCDIAILVIDIMHGLEPQTIESINLLKNRKTPFVVALNKIDRLYQWKSNPNSDVMNTIKRQTPMCKQEFDERTRDVIVQLAEQGLNAALFYENKNVKEYVSLIPTSAHSGDGMGNLVALICELTQTMLAKKISYSEELHATVMEVKSLPGLGTTIDVILVNGKISEGQHVVIAGTEGPIVTQIRGLLMPQPMKELRVKSQYEHHKEVHAAQGVKIIGKDFEKALAGLPMFVAHDDDEIEYYKDETASLLKEVLNSIKLTERGVFVQASTLGSLEALLEYLRTSKIPYAGINIGPVHKKDIMKASIMLEHDSQYASILAFDVKVERDAQEMADSVGVRIFTADIIYHLFDAFTAFQADLKKKRQEEFKHIAVFPCKLRVLPQFIFNSRDPIVMGVVVEAGFVKEGTPICVPAKEFVFLGRITSVEINNKTVDVAKKGQEVCIKIENVPGETPKLYGRHFDHEDVLVSKVSRMSIDAVKNHFREEMTKPDWGLLVELKKLFDIL